MRVQIFFLLVGQKSFDFVSVPDRDRILARPHYLSALEKRRLREDDIDVVAVEIGVCCLRRRERGSIWRARVSQRHLLEIERPNNLLRIASDMRHSLFFSSSQSANPVGEFFLKRIFKTKLYTNMNNNLRIYRI